MEIEATRIFDGRKVALKETDQALTPFGGMVVFLEFLNRIGFVKKSDRVYADYPPVAELDPSGADLYRISHFCGGGSAPLRADQLAERRPCVAWAHGLGPLSQR